MRTLSGGLASFVAAAMAALASVSGHAAPIVGNASFETPVVSGDTYTSPFGTLNGATDMAPWVFGASGGASYDGLVVSGGGLSASGIPDGNQAAFLQGTGTISQSITGFVPGLYTVSFEQEERGGGLGPDPIQVQFDGTTLTFGGSSTTSAGSTFATVTSDPIVLTGGTHVLSLSGTIAYDPPVDRTSFVDLVSVTHIVPEPASLALGGLGALALLALSGKRNAKSSIHHPTHRVKVSTMTKKIAVTLMLLAVGMLASNASVATAGPVINVDFDNSGAGDTGMTPTPYTSKAAPDAYQGSTWNDLPSAASGGPVSLVDSLGSTTGVSLSWANGSGTSDHNFSALPMLHEAIFVGGQTGTLTLTGLNDAQTYNLYVASQWQNAFGGTFSVNGSPTQSTTGANGTSWIAGTDYVLFANLHPTSNTLTISYTEVGGLGILNGLQLAAVPEPSTFVLAGVGVLGLMLTAARRRRQS